MTSEEKIAHFQNYISNLENLNSRLQEENKFLKEEMTFWRKLIAMKLGLSNEQLNQLFIRDGFGGLVGSPMKPMGRNY